MEKFLKTASVVVTGYSGYVGTATSESLKEKGYTVIGFDKQDKNDTRNIFKLFRICLKKPNAIIHLSAKKSIPESIKNPTSYYLNNLISTLVVGITSRVFNIPANLLPPDFKPLITFLAGDCNNAIISPTSSSFDLS